MNNNDDRLEDESAGPDLPASTALSVGALAEIATRIRHGAGYSLLSGRYDISREQLLDLERIVRAADEHEGAALFRLADRMRDALVERIGDGTLRCVACRSVEPAPTFEHHPRCIALAWDQLVWGAGGEASN